MAGAPWRVDRSVDMNDMPCRITMSFPSFGSPAYRLSLHNRTLSSGCQSPKPGNMKAHGSLLLDALFLGTRTNSTMVSLDQLRVPKPNNTFLLIFFFYLLVWTELVQDFVSFSTLLHPAVDSNNFALLFPS